MSAQTDSHKSILYALVANFAIAAAKTTGAVFTGSTSMLAEAIHSFADCGNQALLIWGLKEAKRSATPDHPLGHGKAIYFWSFIVALMLFSMGGQSLWAWSISSRQSELVVILGEDIAALGGLALALAFIVLAVITGNPNWDALGSIAIGGLLIVVALMIGVKVKGLLVGQSAEPRVLHDMREHLSAAPEVAQLYNLLTQQLGEEIMVAIKARMHPQGSEAALIKAINRVEQGFRAAFPQVRWVFFEPDLAD